MADLSQLNVNNNDYNLKDAAARNDIQSTQVVSGNPLTLTDCALINAESLVVEFSPKQDLHGYDYPWVGGAGKNKLPIDLATMKSLNSGGTWSGNVYTHNNGVTFTVLTDSDGNVTGIKANGTASTTLSFVICNVTYSSGSFYLTGLTDYGNGSTRFNLRLTSGGTTISDYFSASGTEFSVTESTTFLCAINVYGGYTCSNLMFYPMVRLSSVSDTTFEKWSNICPITGYDECEVGDVGKNLIDPTTLDLYDVTGTGTMRAGYAPIELEAGTYSVSWASANTGILLTNITDGYANTTLTNGGNFTLNSTSEIMIRTGATSVSNVAISNIQLEKGNQATTYEPYRSSNATIQFGQTVYGGSVDFLTGVLTVDKGFDTFDGSSDEEWANYTTYNGFNIEAQDMRSGYYLDGISNEFKTINQHTYGIRFGADNNRIYVEYVTNNISGVTDLSSWKTWLSNNPLEVCYPLAEPFTIQLTPKELKLLKQYNNITTNGTTINLGYQPDNVIGEVKGEIEAITEMDYLRILDNNVDTPINNYRIYYHLISGAYTLVNMGEMLNHRFIFVEIIKNPSGGVNKKVLHSALIDPRTIDGYEYEMKAGGNDTIWIESILDENKFNLSLRTTGGSYSDGDPTDYYVTIRMVD